MTDAEKDAKTQYEAARQSKDALKRDLETGNSSRAERLQVLNQLWRHVQDFIPRHWRQD